MLPKQRNHPCLGNMYNVNAAKQGKNKKNRTLAAQNSKKHTHKRGKKKKKKKKKTAKRNDCAPCSVGGHRIINKRVRSRRWLVVLYISSSKLKTVWCVHSCCP